MVSIGVRVIRLCVLAALTTVVWSVTASAQCTSQFPAYTTCNNPNGSQGQPTATANPVIGGNINVLGTMFSSASTASRAGFNFAPGIAPTSPNNGDAWVTSTGFYTQINGSTVGPFGTVTSVALSLPSSILTVTGSPVTTSGTLTGTLATQTANYVWSGPATGSPAAPTFRALVSADLPLATTSLFGAVKPDGTTVSISAGIISCTTATTSQIGCVKPDGTIITDISGAITVVKATSSAFGVVRGDNSTISLSGGIISCSTATTSQIGCVKPDGTTITISAGTITAVSTSIVVGTTVISGGSSGCIPFNNSGGNVGCDSGLTYAGSSGAFTAGGAIKTTATTAASSATTGSGIFGGGIGVAGAGYFGGGVVLTSGNYTINTSNIAVNNISAVRSWALAYGNHTPPSLTGFDNLLIGEGLAPNATTAAGIVCIGQATCSGATTDLYMFCVGPHACGAESGSDHSVVLGAFAAENGTGAFSQITLVGVSAGTNLAGTSINVSCGGFNCLGAAGLGVTNNDAIWGSRGFQAVTTGYQLSGVGDAVCAQVTTGYDIACLGYLTGRGLTTGNSDLILGDNIGTVTPLPSGLTGAIVIGPGDGSVKADFNLTNSGVWTFASQIVIPGVVFTSLPGAVTGMVAYITDGKSTNCGDSACTTFGTSVTGGGGALKLRIWYNGVNWTLTGK
jgi:hypothetical protein